MKNYSEITDDLLKRRDAYIAQQKKKKNSIYTAGAIISGLCLALLIGFGVRYALLSKNTLPEALEEPVSDGESTEIKIKDTPDPGEDISPAADGNESVPLPENSETSDKGEVPDTSADPAETSDPGDGENTNVPNAPKLTDDEVDVPAQPPEPPYDEDNDMPGASAGPAAFINWTNKIIGYSLYTAFENTPADSVMEIKASPYLSDDFVYGGKTLGQLQDEAYAELHYPEKLLMLLKEGDDLKYGEALCQTGNAEGIKWARSLYDEKVAFYGQELLDKYIVGGVFLKEQLEAEIAESQFSDAAQRTYNAACEACRNEYFEGAKNQLSRQGISFELRSGANYIIIYASRNQFGDMTLDGADDWYYDLYSPGGYDDEVPTAETA